MSHINEAPLNFDTNATFSANETFRVDFAVPIGNSSTNKAIGKGDKLAGDKGSKNDQYAGLSDSNLDGTQTVVQKDLNLITRSAASSQISQSLGLNSVVAEAYAKAPDDRNIGVSAMASGSQLMTNAVDAQGKPEAIITRDFDFSRPEIQKGLYDLEAVDYLTGQIDRHSGNIFINNQTGQVEGIDNDLCLGDKPLSVATRDVGVGGKTVGSPPLFYHQDTAAAIEKMTPKKLTEILKGVTAPDGTHGLNDKEIAAAVGRLKTMQSSILLARSEGRVVAQFDQDTFKASVKHNEAKSGEAYRGSYAATGNYVGRSQKELEYAKAQSQQPNPFDRIDPPGGARPLTPYEQGLVEQKAAVKQTEAKVLADPGVVLKQALAQKQNLENEIAGLDATINKALENKSSLNSQLALNEQAQAALAGNMAKLKACQGSDASKPDSPAITADQAKLINNMVSGIEPVEAGQRLNQGQRNQIGATTRALSDRQLADMRSKEVEAQTSFVRSAAPEVQQQRKEALTKLAEVEATVQTLVKSDPRMQQAVAAEKNFIDSSKSALIQQRDEKIIAQAAEAQLQSEPKFAESLENQSMPVPELPQEPARAQDLTPQIETGEGRVENSKSKVALEAQKNEEIKSLKAHLGDLDRTKDHLENNATKGEKFKALLKNGPKGIAAEVAKLDMEILATKKALEIAQGGTGVDQQKADIHQMKGDLQASKQQLDQVKKDLKAAEKTIKSVELQADLDGALLGPSISDKQRDNLVRQANAAINVREALKPQAKELKEAQIDLKADVKIGEKAMSVRDKVGPKPVQAAIGGHRSGGPAH